MFNEKPHYILYIYGYYQRVNYYSRYSYHPISQYETHFHTFKSHVCFWGKIILLGQTLQENTVVMKPSEAQKWNGEGKG